MIHTRSYSDLYACVRPMVEAMPWVPDLVVGVPRSGMLIAEGLGLYLNRPVLSLDQFCMNINPIGGNRISTASGNWPPAKVVVVDDSVMHGSAMERAKLSLPRREGLEYAFGAAFVSELGSKPCDFYGEIVPGPRVFAWNVLHHEFTTGFMFDLDGVFCADPKTNEVDDPVAYLEEIRGLSCNMVPAVGAGTIVTSRLAKHSMVTQIWLREHSIRYGGLVMLSGVTAAERRRRKVHALHKSKHFALSTAPLFIESARLQAEAIACLTGKVVYCTETNEFFDSGINQIQPRSKRIAAKILQRARLKLGTMNLKSEWYLAS